MGQLSELKSHVSDNIEFGRRLSEQFSGEIDTIQTKVKELEKVSLEAVEGSMGDAAATMLANIDLKVEKVKEEFKNMKVKGTQSSQAVLVNEIPEPQNYVLTMTVMFNLPKVKQFTR